MALACLILGASMLLVSETARAQAAAPAQDPELPLLDTAQEQASEAVLDVAEWLDDFFDDDRARIEENRTRIRMELSSGYTRFEQFEIKPRISGRIDLPHLNKKLNLLISASDDEEFIAERTPISAFPRHQGSKNREVAAALQYFHREEKESNLSSTLGVSLQYVYAGIRFRHSQDFGSWNGRFVNRLLYFTDDGLEDVISYELGHYLSERCLFRTTIAADWLRDESGLPHSLVFRLFQMINEQKALLYEVGNYFDTEDSYKMTDLQLRLRYRQRFLRDWLVLEIAPQLTFPEDHDREPNPGLIVKFEADTGNLAGTEIFHRIFNF